ncbi:MAG TPA: hypothetical protein VGQ46_02710 [Thermoanaerobaculia bacterium]|jgi:hypothetical protein|nr:hypothetical protein [Thermoanaerobaculia bacterium]
MNYTRTFLTDVYTKSIPPERHDLIWKLHEETGDDPQIENAESDRLHLRHLRNLRRSSRQPRKRLRQSPRQLWIHVATEPASQEGGIGEAGKVGDFYWLLSRDQLVSPAASQKMRAIFLSPGIPHDDHKFVKALAGRGLTILRKWGSYEDLARRSRRRDDPQMTQMNGDVPFSA